MLMGRSQFHKGAFEEAAATFAYMSRIYKGQPAIYGKARAWLAKCYIEQDWLYDAEDVISEYATRLFGLASCERMGLYLC